MYLIMTPKISNYGELHNAISIIILLLNDNYNGVVAYFSNLY